MAIGAPRQANPPATLALLCMLSGNLEAYLVVLMSYQEVPYAPPTWPIYRLNPAVQVKTDDKVPLNGIYLPAIDDSCAQFMVQGYNAWQANVGYDAETMQRISEQPTVWTLVERIADSGGGIPGTETVITQANAGLRCEAKQPCPQTGWWFTPAKADSRRRFKQGETMPEFQTDYGMTVWYWDGQQD